MWRIVDQLPSGITFAIVIFTYLALTAFLSRFVSVALSQAIAIPVISLFSFLVLNKRRDFFKHLFYGILVGVIVFALLRIFS